MEYKRKKYFEVDGSRSNIWNMDKSSAGYFKEMIRNFRVREFVRLKGQKTLDLGCGDGYFSYLLAKDNNKVIALDVSQNRLDKFKKVAKKFNIKQVLYNGKKIPFKASYFDSVVILEVIEHLDSFQKILVEAQRVVKKKGQVIVATPYRENLAKERYLCPHCLKRFHRFGHLHSFDLPKMKNELKKAKIKYSDHALIVNYKTEIFKQKTGIGFGWLALTLDRFYSKKYPKQNKYLVVRGIKE